MSTEQVQTIRDRYRAIECLLATPEVTSDYKKVQALAKEQTSIRSIVEIEEGLQVAQMQLEEALSLIRDETDSEIVAMARSEEMEARSRIELLEQKLTEELLPKNSNDEKNVIMEIRAGAGGSEARLFAADLYRMYLRLAQRNEWSTDIIDLHQGNTGEIKEITFQVQGAGAYSKLRHESGGHRVQRVPITESKGRIHTSVATVAVLPEAEDIDITIEAKDLKVDIYHAAGHGGQHVQKVATAVRATHIPTGLAATCQDERSLTRNRAKALTVLRSRLLAQETERQNAKLSKLRRSQVGSGDRSDRVRTYNFPQGRVTDHRIRLSKYNLESVLDGDLNEFIDALEHQEQRERR